MARLRLLWCYRHLSHLIVFSTIHWTLMLWLQTRTKLAVSLGSLTWSILYAVVCDRSFPCGENRGGARLLVRALPPRLLPWSWMGCPAAQRPCRRCLSRRSTRTHVGAGLVVLSSGVGCGRTPATGRCRPRPLFRRHNLLVCDVTWITLCRTPAMPSSFFRYLPSKFVLVHPRSHLRHLPLRTRRGLVASSGGSTV